MKSFPSTGTNEKFDDQRYDEAHRLTILHSLDKMIKDCLREVYYLSENAEALGSAAYEQFADIDEAGAEDLAR